MSLGTLIKVDGLAWTGLGAKYEHNPTSSEEIVREAKLDWTVNHEPMYTKSHGEIPGWNTIYREDNNRILGVIHKHRITHVQNIDAFKAVEPLITDGRLSVDTSASFGGTDSVFATFKINEQYKILDDSLDHYFVVINDHLKPDGKVTVLNTPVRVACMNVLAAALTNNLYSMRVPISAEFGINSSTASRIIVEAENSIKYLNARAESMVKDKLSRESVEKVLDILFPYLPSDSIENRVTKHNESTEIIRMTFIKDCLDADNLQNYKGTHYAMFNAITDFSQHYFKKVDTGYDLNYRMKTLPGISSEGPANMVKQYMKVAKSLIAA